MLVCFLFFLLSAIRLKLNIVFPVDVSFRTVDSDVIDRDILVEFLLLLFLRLGSVREASEVIIETESFLINIRDQEYRVFTQ